MRSFLRNVCDLAWFVWNLRSICRACAEEERDARLLARDGGAAS